MTKIDEFISKLEDNKTTPKERKEFIESLNKRDFISFLKKDFSKDTFLKTMFDLFGESLPVSDEVDNQSVDTRSDLFEEYLDQTQALIRKFNIEEIKKALRDIKPEYVTIKNLFLEHLVQLIHNTKEPIDIKRLVEFKTRIEKRQITPEDIRTTLLRMPKEEFSFFICIDNQETNSYLRTISNQSIELDNMYEYQAEIIAEIIEDYTEDEIIELIPVLNDSSKKIRNMFFKCLNEKKASEIFLTNAPKYSNDIYNYIMSPALSEERDKLIVRILSDVNLYSLFSESELYFLRTNLSNGEHILDESSNIINTYEVDLCNEAIKYIANIRGRDKKSIKNGILKKLSAKKIHHLLIEANKGLVNIGEKEISIKEFLFLIEMPVDKAILFLKECTELTEEEKKALLNELYKDNEYSKLSISEARNKIINKYAKLVVNNKTYLSSDFAYCYKDILELDYNKGFLDDMIKKYSQNMFVTVSLECMNIFLAQIIEREKTLYDIELEKEFYVGRTYTNERPNQNVKLGGYTASDKTISINTNAYSELAKSFDDTSKDTVIKIFLQKVSMIETVFHELRHSYQNERMQEIGSMRDFYFMLDELLHKESYLSTTYYNANYDVDSRETDANLYAKVATCSLFKSNPIVKNIYWKVFGKDAHKLAKQRKSPQLRKKWSFEQEQTTIINMFFNEMSPIAIKRLSEEYPMLALITDEGYQLSEEELVERYMAVETALRENNIENKEDYEVGESILKFLKTYLEKVHNKKVKMKKAV